MMPSFLHPSPPMGEHAATALENNLSNLECRLDAILAALEAKEDPQSPATAIASKAEDSSKAKGAEDPKDEPHDGTNGDAVKVSKDTA
ncbi:uncharacterized protein FTOL_05347 [Fusarium torulosum]|uniref:Uncharacterized protein n=1 Tax=Fusarium torulosum TaxID=33205 RepID=A0AAE8SH69_9HYPO|nr:uncharacterized protein FTOL_05347 [Fusarium torulosum]